MPRLALTLEALKERPWPRDSIDEIFYMNDFMNNAELIRAVAYLARAGNCAACHTARGGAPYAGGRAIATPFGTVFSSNLTPDAATGLGAWTGAEFWRQPVPLPIRSEQIR